MKARSLVPLRVERTHRLPVRFEHDSILAFRREADRFYNDYIAESNWPGFDSQMEFSPKLNVTESNSVFEVSTELPGLNEDDIKVTLNHDVLTIEGEKGQEVEHNEGSFYRMERQYGSFRRSVNIPADKINSDRIEASFKNGVLFVTLPKNEESQEIVKRITISAG